MRYNPEIHHRRSIRLKGYDYSSNGAYYITINTQNREFFFGDIIDAEMVLNDAGRMIEEWYKKLPDKFPGVELDEYVVMPDHFHCIVVIDDSGQTDNIKGQTHGSARTAAVFDTDCVIKNENNLKHVGANLRVHPKIPNIGKFTINKNDSNIDNNIDDKMDSMIGDIDDREILGQTHGSAPTGVFDTDCVIKNENNFKHVGAHLCVHPNLPNIGKFAINENDPNIIYNADIPRIIQWFKTMTTNEYIRGVKNLGWMPFNKKMWQRNYYEHIIRDDGSLERIRNYIINNPGKWKNNKDKTNFVSDLHEIYGSEQVKESAPVGAHLRVRPEIPNNRKFAINEIDSVHNIEKKSNIDNIDNEMDFMIGNIIYFEMVGQTHRSAPTGLATDFIEYAGSI